MGFAWNQLEDEYPVNASRIGGYFCSLEDIWASRNTHGLTSFNLVGEYVAAKTSHIYASREVLRNRFLSIVIPEYESQTQRSNQDAAPQASNSVSTASFSTLDKLIRDLVGADIEVLIVAMPVRDQYQFDDHLPQTVQEAGAAFLDQRTVSELDTSLFVDNMHLDAQGMAIFTRELSRELQRLNVGE
jgi:hypothetical protein